MTRAPSPDGCTAFLDAEGSASSAILMGADLAELTIDPGPGGTIVAAKIGGSIEDTIVYDACVGFGPDFRPISGLPLEEYLPKLTDAGPRERIVPRRISGNGLMRKECWPADRRFSRRRKTWRSPAVLRRFSSAADAVSAGWSGGFASGRKQRATRCYVHLASASFKAVALKNV